ncbi:protein POF1B isoform X1 [Anguilla anguilla]|uniref:protein POF1B isoform X1 n=1 Tax=Anguilla anguilla TaxID=7936 RepID=UPI0015B36BC3|nr:protein POF1B isoform X1 [Anguilla anguilla]
MSVPLSHGVSTYRTVSVSSETLPGTASSTVQYTTNESPYSSYRTLGVPVSPVSPVQYAVNGGAVDGNVVYGTLRYLVPVERRVMPTESYMIVNSAPQIMANQAVAPMYIRGYSVSSQDGLEVRQQSVVDVESVNGKASSVVSRVSTPPKSPEPEPQEEEVVQEEEEEVVVEPVVQRVSRVSVRTEVPLIEPQAKLDTRFFGELLADIYRKNCDIHTCVSEHVSKIRGRKQTFDPSDYKVSKEEVEALIPDGLSELTKQQIRYLLQTRMTADNTMRLLLSTFSTLREELSHLQGDLKRLESEKEELERDLSFKADQAQQYDRLLESVRENNRQLQASLKESSAAQRTLETQLISSRSSDSSLDFRVKEQDGRLKALEKENEMLRQKLAGQGSSSSVALQTKTEELSRHYDQMLSSLREEKDKEMQNLKAQMMKMQTEYSSQSSGDRSLQLRITELISTLEQREIIIKRQEEEIKRLKTVEKTDSSSSSSSSKNVTVVTKRYNTNYPILGLLSDDYKYEAPIRESRTVVFESSRRV